jgi:hypothetical protein
MPAVKVDKSLQDKTYILSTKVFISQGLAILSILGRSLVIHFIFIKF